MRAALVLLAACGGAVPALPSKGGPAWVEVQSEHFTLVTDAGEGRGTELVEQMEYLHQIVFGVAFPSWSDAGRAFAIGLRDSNELHAYLPQMFGAVSEDWRAWLLVLGAHASGDEAKIARAHASTLAAGNPAAMVPANLCPSVHAVDAVPGGGEDSDQPARPEQVP